MRRASTRLALLGLAVAALSLPAIAGAAPEVKLRVKAVPIPKNPSSNGGPTYPGTGNLFGAGAALESEFNIKGTEYAGGPLPLIGVKVVLPAGATVSSKGFTTCSAAILESHEVQKCPKKSVAGPKGFAKGAVSFGATRVPETLSVQPFFDSKGGLSFYAEGTTPASIELLSAGKILSGGGGSGPVFTTEVPLVSTVPEAPYGSVEVIKVKVGAAFMKGKKLVSYGTIPKKCAKGGFPIKAELTFLGNVVVPVSVTAPCPKK